MLSLIALPIVLLLPLTQPATSYWKGFNLAGTLPTTGCKTQDDWTHDFTVLQSLPGYFTSARLYAASDCNTLALAVPAAIATNTTLMVGVWTEDNAHFEAEKQALLEVTQAHGADWLIAVAVGSEDLYRGDTDAATLAKQIGDVKGMMCGLGTCDTPVGHVDTWTAWVNASYNDVIRACDFIGTDGYPYFQASTIQDGYDVFWESVEDTRNMVNAVKPGTWVWITETGWPVSAKMVLNEIRFLIKYVIQVTGPDFGASVPSLPNAQSYWKSVACQAFEEAHTFWYTLQDYTSSPSFGVVDPEFKPLYDLSC